MQYAFICVYYQTLTSPTAYWDADPNGLYTFMLEDEDIDFLPIKLMHMMVTNIRGNFIFLAFWRYY